MVLHLKVAWEWIKKNWKMLCLFLWTVAVWFLSRRSSQAAIDAMNANKESYEARIKSLKQQHRIEIQKREELDLKYKQTLAKIEEKYNKKKEKLTKLEKLKVKEIIKKSNGDPGDINKKIEDLFGFTHDSNS